MLPAWDDNMMLSFHKYWNRNTDADLADILGLRDTYRMPVWLGGAGENSNVWFRDAIRLVEPQGIGGSWWPLKKIGLSNPPDIASNPHCMPIIASGLRGGRCPSTAGGSRRPTRPANQTNT